MRPSIYDRILRRELGETSNYSKIPGFYGSKEWVQDLDIVNELGGHTGCVNALSWSRSGRLLASGSDDTYLNIYSYQPDSSTAPFALNTTVATGHRANIFSVKFMPHSNDQTLVTCAGDFEVRVFDVEYSFRHNAASRAAAEASSARSRRITNFFSGVRYLSERNTNARVYRSHADRVKRIVTESSPYLFLTCSEDGEVRQWDLRQPSSAYPAPSGGHGFMPYHSRESHDDSNVPPPLISYKQYHLDLNTISCSASQPHYIALGGAHLHCFLHDRRMIGRDLLAEAGQPGSGSPVAGTSEDKVMASATRCVRRFAPKGQKRMDSQCHGHITACKISDANPNEMVVSWSGDHIYSFDIIRSPDARDTPESESTLSRKASSPGSKKVKTRKRKHEKITSVASPDADNNRSSPPFSSDVDHDDPELSLRVRFGNGESGNISIPTARQTPHQASSQYSVLNEAQKLGMRIARAVLKLRKHMFSLDSPKRESSESNELYDASLFVPHFSEALGYASTYLSQMDDVIRGWRYPIDPSQHQVILQQTLRRNREATRRFVQAAGTLARFLGGTIRTPSSAENPRLGLFRRILPAPTEDGVIDVESQFAYDFLKAILLWLDGGREALLSGFKLGQANRRNRRRFPIPDDAGDEAIEGTLIPYLQSLAGSAAIINVDASRFEYDDTRVIFPTQSAAVDAFAEAVRRPVDNGGEAGPNDPHAIDAQQRASLVRFWGLKVARGLLMSVAEDLNFQYVNRAFSGLRMAIEEDEDEDGWGRLQEDIDVDEEDEEVKVDISRVVAASHRAQAHQNAHLSDTDIEGMEIDGHSERDVEQDDNNAEDDQHGEEEGNLDDEDEEDEDNDAMGESDDDDVDESDDEDQIGGYFVRRTGVRDDALRNVEIDVPCSSHVNVYRGHCNIKTVKDVNYFGLDDEYVVSGSDSGHVFIWDRKTSDLVNILHGDGEVVNVVQGHPYEPTLAVSGIDNTVKIFSPDRRAQDDARKGVNILNPESPANMFTGRLRAGENGAEEFGLSSAKRMHDSYRIMSQNDNDRRGGMNEALITRSVLARLAVTLRERRGAGGGIPNFVGEPGDRATIVLDENCTVM